MTEDGQSTEEIAASTGPGTAADFVLAWADVVLNQHDWALAMQVATPELRLAAARQFVYRARQLGMPEIANWDRDALADDLAAVNIANPVWDRFAAAELESFEAFRGTRLAVGARQRLIDIDHARVVLIDYDNSPHPAQIVDGQEMKLVGSDQELVGWTLIARRVNDDWLLASYGEDLPRPEWPPTLS